MNLKMPNIISSLLSDLFATDQDVERSGLLSKKGVVLGTTSQGRYLMHNDLEHILVSAPSRSGKGAGIIVPTLLVWPYSVVVFDIKGENWYLTSGFRQKELNNKIIKIDFTEDNPMYDFNIADIVNPNQPVSIYLTVNPARFTDILPLIRTFFKKIITEAKTSNSGNQNLLLVLDEFQVFGRMDFFVKALSSMNDYGLKALMLVQNLYQIEQVYSGYDTIGKCPIKVIYRPTDIPTAEIAAYETGEVLRGKEILKLSNDKNLILMPGIPPIKAYKILYFINGDFMKRILPPAKINNQI